MRRRTHLRTWYLVTDGERIEDIERSPISFASGGLASSAADLMRYLQSNLETSGPLADALLLSQRVSVGVTAFGTSVTGNGWFRLKEADIYWHAGSAPGYHGFMAFNPPTKRAVVILTNTSMPPNDARAAIAAFQILND